ncbi:MAG: hypothetical protein V1737_02630 [Chloroflexota bacterium]
MPERGFASETWNSDEWFQDLARDQRYLFIYLWTNDHCNQAGLYHITLKTIADETLFPKEALPELLSSLTPKVIWYPESNLVWVKNFLKRQSKSSKFLAAAAKCLTSIRDNNTVQELLDYNMRRYSISIPYQYYIDRISILTRVTGPDTDTVSGSGFDRGVGEGVVKGKQIPRSRLEAEETLCEGGRGEVAPKGAGDSHRAEGDGAIISAWRSVKGWILAPDEELELVARLRTGFPELDLLAESQTWAARKLSEPLKPNSKPSQQIWNWMRKAREFTQERRERDQGKGQRAKVHPREAYSGRSW